MRQTSGDGSTENDSVSVRVEERPMPKDPPRGIVYWTVIALFTAPAASASAKSALEDLLSLGFESLTPQVEIPSEQRASDMQLIEARGCFVTYSPTEAAKGIRHWRSSCNR